MIIKLSNIDRDPHKYLLDSLEETIRRLSSEGDRKPSRSFKPSNLQCSRRAYYQLQAYSSDEGNERDPSLVGVTETGTDRHERLQNWLMKVHELDYDVEYIDILDFLEEHPNDDIKFVKRIGAEVKLYNSNYNMSFMCDGIVKIRGEYYILEIKTESTWKFKYRTDIAKEHIRQATAYYMNFGLPVIFLYENRDFNEKKTFLYKPTDEDVADVLKVMLEANEAVKKGKVPPIPKNIKVDLELAFDKKKYTERTREKYRQDGWRDFVTTCKYCEYKDRCEGEKNE